MIIGFTGPMGSGKSTAIEFLKKRLLGSTVNVKFAQPLYDIQEAVYSRITPVYYRPDNFVKDRKLLQWIGTDWGRESISESLWVDLWRAKVKEVLNPEFDRYGPLHVTCDDVRFDNEAVTLKSLGGFVVKIFADSTDKRIDTASGIVLHKSEAGVNHELVDYLIDNSGTLAQLEKQVNTLVDTINERNVR